MHVISFEHEPSSFDSDDTVDQVRILINGVPLQQLVENAESADGYGRTEHVGIRASDATPGHFLGDSERTRYGTQVPEREPGRTLLLTCTCGELGCWPWSAIIQVGLDHVVWSDFRHGHREEWRYETLGEDGKLVFDRAQYEAALAAANLL